VYLPILYLKGFIIASRQTAYKNNNSSSFRVQNKRINWKKAIFWIVEGLYLLPWAIVRDSYHFWSIVYKNFQDIVDNEYDTFS